MVHWNSVDARTAGLAAIPAISVWVAAFGRRAAAQHAHCPAAVIHGIAAIDPVSAAMPVLVGVDGSANSMPAVKLAFDEASRRKVELVALPAFSDAGALDLPAFGWEVGRVSAEADLAETLAGFAEQYPDVPVRRIVVANRRVRSLLDLRCHGPQHNWGVVHDICLPRAHGQLRRLCRRPAEPSTSQGRPTLLSPTPVAHRSPRPGDPGSSTPSRSR